jgi:hypothetical protein
MFGFALAPLLKPILIGAGTGALGGLLTGKDPFKGALIGGATGGLLGAAAPAAGAAGTGGASVSIASPTASMFGSPVGATGLVGAGNSALGSGIGAGFGAASAPLASIDPMSGVNAFLEPATQTSGIVGSTGELGANMGLVNPMTIDPTEMFSSQIPNMGAEAFTQQPSMFESFYDKVKPYVDVRDIGTTALKSQLQSQPRQQISPQSGRVTEGRAPQGNDVMALLQSIKMPDRRRITLL